MTSPRKVPLRFHPVPGENFGKDKGGNGTDDCNQGGENYIGKHLLFSEPQAVVITTTQPHAQPPLRGLIFFHFSLTASAGQKFL